MDFAKAFDSVTHGRLLLKLKAYGIRDKLNGWCAAFKPRRRGDVLNSSNPSVRHLTAQSSNIY